MSMPRARPARPARRSAGLARAAATLVGTAVASVAPLAGAGADTLLAIGDSITEGHVGGQCSYRRPMLEILSNTPGCEVRFVGSRREDAGRDPRCAATLTPHYGISGLQAEFFVSGAPSRIEREVVAHAPDRVLLMLGTNDLYGSRPVDTIVGYVDAAVGQILGQDPGTVVHVANVPPWDDARAGTSGVGERARRFGEGLRDAVARRRAAGEPVRFVDVRTGFDAATMTTDGVHPDDAGERLIADRFVDSLAADGPCAAFRPPARTLESGRWYQLGLPGRPGLPGPGGDAGDTVADVFGDDLPMAGFGNGAATPSWALFEHVPDGTGASAYVELSASSALAPGRAYWMIQSTGAPVTVDLPDAALPAPLTDAPGCAGPSGCFVAPLPGGGSADVAWASVANPFVRDLALDGTRTVTDGGPCGSGCAPGAARTADASTGTVWRYDGAAGRYDALGAGAALAPWDGAWLGALPGARDRAPRWLPSPD